MLALSKGDGSGRRRDSKLKIAEPLAKAAWGLGSLIEPRADITIVVRKRDLSPRSGIDQFVLQEAPQNENGKFCLEQASGGVENVQTPVAAVNAGRIPSSEWYKQPSQPSMSGELRNLSESRNRVGSESGDESPHSKKAPISIVSHL
jgi:hypothetical protein